MSNRADVKVPILEMMMSASTVVGPAVVPNTQSKPTPTPKRAAEKKPKAKPKEARDRNARILPTERINFDKQLKLLLAYAAASANQTKVVRLEDVAPLAEMAETTISMANPFFGSIGLVTRTDSGGFIPAPEVISFLRARDWTPDTASHKLAPVIEASWFYQALRPRLVMGPMEEEVVITTVFAEAAAAGRDYRRNLQMLVEYVVASGLVQRDGSQLKLVCQSPAVPADPTTPRPEPTKQNENELPAKTRVATNFLKTADGAVLFNVSAKVDMQELATWPPQRINAFFNGIAAVMRAKAGVEQEIPAVEQTVGN
jgi:hypothetical protein